jgi:hypothetical protein
MTASIARVKSAKSIGVRTVNRLPAGAGAPERAGHRDHPGPARQRHHRAVPPGCALRPSVVAALTDGRCSGAFTAEATVAARHVNTPELSVWCLRHPPHFAHPPAGGRGDGRRAGLRAEAAGGRFRHWRMS